MSWPPGWSPPEIARAEEGRQARGTAEVVPEAEPIAGGWMTFDAIGSWANQAVGLGLHGPVSEGDLERLVAFYVERGVEPRLEVCAFAHESLLQGLAARGFVLREFEDVLARPLDPGEDLRALLPHGWPAGLTCERVDPNDPEAVERFVEVTLAGFQPDVPPDPVFAAITRRVLAHPRNDAFLLHLDGEVAGVGGMETAGAISCQFGGVVLPAFRRRGLQAALIVARLERARERGATLVCTHSSPGIPTERNALRLGFRLAYAKVVLVKPGEGLASSL